MLDSFLVGLGAFYPQSWLKPQLIPWNPAAAENFYKNPMLAWLADNWKCIWVREGRRDLHALHRMMEGLPRGTMTLFPEGTRSRDGSVGPGRPGPGPARGLYGLARDAAYARDGSGGDRPRDGSDSGPARRAPAPAEARRRGRGRGTGVIGGFGRNALETAWLPGRYTH